MKRNKHHIVWAWILLFCFFAGQWVVYAHQHKNSSGVYNTAQSSQKKQTVTEKCQLCDAMHYNSMMIHSYTYFTPAVVAGHLYKPGQYDFVSIALILSPGRAPPVV